MPFRFKRRESVAEGFARIAREEIEGALALLQKADAAQADEDIHAVRKSIKRLRALLRLARGGQKEACMEARQNLRAAARQLSPLRDAQVRLQTFDVTLKKTQSFAAAGLRRELARELEETISDIDATRLAEVADLLRNTQRHFEIIKLDGGWPLVRQGLERSYRRARKAHAVARAEVTTAALHVWRKRAKDFEYQLLLIRKAAPRELRRLGKEATRLTERLGEDHDLAVLDELIVGHHPLAAEVRESIRARIAEHRRKLQREAFKIAPSIFTEKPSVLMKDLHRAWKGWHRG